MKFATIFRSRRLQQHHISRRYQRRALLVLTLLIGIAAIFSMGLEAGAQSWLEHGQQIVRAPRETTLEQREIPDPPGTIRGERVEGELLVKFGENISTKISRSVHKRIGAHVLKQFSSINWQHVSLPPGLSVEDAIARYRNLPGVIAAQPNYVYHVAATPNDPMFDQLYGMQQIHAPEAWDVTTGSNQVVVAVIDTGIFYPHEDLSANMWRNPGETGTDANGNDRATNGIDDDNDGYVDDVYGIDTYNHDSDPIDDRGHGTHVAGIIGAAGNNGVGVVGVNWQVRLMALKFLAQNGSGTSAGAIECFDYVVMMKARGVNVRVTNNSYGATDDAAMREAMDAAGNAGVLNVCAAGNNAMNTDNTPFFPASFDSPYIISVAASDQNDNPASFTNYGATTVDLAAPGVNILSTVHDGPKYITLSGTSMSSPHVAGAAALLLAHDASLTPASLKATLMNTVDVLPQWAGKVVSGGRLNVARALQSLTACSFSLSPNNLSFTSNPGTGRVAISSTPNCEWAAQANAGWITITNRSGGSGNLYFTVSANNTQTQRTAQITVADQSITVTQEAAPPQSCASPISPSSQHFSMAGGAGSVQVTAPNGCNWSAVSNDYWIGVTQGSSGSGNGSVNFAVEANSSFPARTGTIMIAGQTFTVTQDSDCTYSLTPTSQTFPAVSQTQAPAVGIISVSAGSSCIWSAVSNASWIQIVSGSSGQGGGKVAYIVNDNNTGNARTGNIWVADQTFTVTQSANTAAPTVTLTKPASGTKLPGPAQITLNADAMGNAHSVVRVDFYAQENGPVNSSGAPLLIGSATTSPYSTVWEVRQTDNYVLTAIATDTAGLTTTSAPVPVMVVPSANISGNITDEHGTPYINITVQLTSSQPGDNTSVQTNGFGVFNFFTLPQGLDYTVTPLMPGYAVNPTSRSVTNLSGNQNFDFIAMPTSCSYSLSSVSRNFPASGGDGVLGITTEQGCVWKTLNTPLWMKFSAVDGTGSATISYVVTENRSTSPRAATINIGDQTFDVTQDGNPSFCDYTVSPTEFTYPGDGGSGQITVTASSSTCSWNGVSNDGWITISGAQGGTGNGAINFTVAQNPGAFRIGSLNVAGRAVTVQQKPMPVGGASMSQASAAQMLLHLDFENLLSSSVFAPMLIQETLALKNEAAIFIY
ncbi:MAG TPA: S8 family serine peptidase [Pyrinomonadaceae bacterium]|nr:S8 family serine peptidase [Pyrinomonadaceae bacterium]